MGLRNQLRELIDALEYRWEHLSDDSTSFSQDIASLLRSDDIRMIRQASDTRSTLCETLSSVHVAVRNERDALLHGERLVQNWQQPAVRLPFEVLELIFKMACVATVREDEESEWAREYRCTRNAINLTCRRWREVALKATGLWCHIFMRNRAQPEAARAPMPNLIPTELERAGGRPLAFYLFNNVIAGDAGEHWQSSMDLTRAELHRCVMYHATLQPFTPFDTFSAPLFLPSLRTLVLTLDHELDILPDIPIQSVIVDLTKAPSLRSLWLRYYGMVDWDYDTPRLFFKLPRACSVTELHVSQEVDSASIIDAINSCPFLETLELDGSDSTPDDRPLIFEPLPHLLNLSVDLGQRFDTDCVQALSAPNLVRLRVQCELVHSPAIWGTCNHIFTAFHFPALRYLEITGNHPSLWPILPPFIASHHNLEEIHLDVSIYPLDEDLCNVLSEFSTHNRQPLLLDVWVRVDPERAPDGVYALDTGLIRRLLLARAQVATTLSQPSFFVLNVDPSWTEPESEDISTYPDVVELVRQYHEGHVVFRLREYDNGMWDWKLEGI